MKKLSSRQGKKRERRIEETLPRHENGKQIINEGLAHLAERMNFTLWFHIPERKKRYPQSLSEEKHLAVLATSNLLHRINLNYSEDLLLEQQLAHVTYDLMEALGDTITTNRPGFSNVLRKYLQYGFLVPRYRVRHRKRGSKQRGVLDFGWECMNFFYDDATDHLQKIQFEWSLPFPDPLQYYQGRGSLIEDPQAITPRHKDVQNLTPVFTFSQIAQLRKIYRLLSSGFANVNLLFFSFQDYKAVREKMLPVIKQTLGEIGIPQFCENEACSKPLANDSRNHYCNDRCQGRVHEGRKRRRKTLRLASDAPFMDYSETPPFLATK